jgi:hypothetical protein
MYKRECLEYGIAPLQYGIAPLQYGIAPLQYRIAPLQSSPVLAGQHCASVLRYARMLLFSGRFLVAASYLSVICFVTCIREGYL